MSLHIVVGYDGQGASAQPSLVYLGRSKSEADAAMAGSEAPRFDVFSNAPCYRKNNSRISQQNAHAAIVAQAEAAQQAGELAPKPVLTAVDRQAVMQEGKARKEAKRLKAELAESQAALARLTAELAALKEAPAPSASAPAPA